MTSSLLLRLVLLVVAFASTTASANPTGSKPPAPPLLFRTLGVGVEARDLFYLDKSKPLPCEVDPQRRSPYYEVSTAGTPLVFFRVVKAGDGTEQRVPVAEVTIEPSIRRALLVFTRGQDAAEPFRILALKDDVSAVPPGGYRVLNYLPVSAGVSAGTEKQVIPPRGVAVIRPRPSADSSIYAFKVFGLTPQTAVPLFSNVFAVDENVRHLVLVVPSPSSPKRMEVKFLGESVNAIRPDDPGPLAAGSR